MSCVFRSRCIFESKSGHVSAIKTNEGIIVSRRPTDVQIM